MLLNSYTYHDSSRDLRAVIVGSYSEAYQCPTERLHNMIDILGFASVFHTTHSITTSCPRCRMSSTYLDSQMMYTTIGQIVGEHSNTEVICDVCRCNKTQFHKSTTSSDLMILYESNFEDTVIVDGSIYKLISSVIRVGTAHYVASIDKSKLYIDDNRISNFATYGGFQKPVISLYEKIETKPSNISIRPEHTSLSMSTIEELAQTFVKGAKEIAKTQSEEIRSLEELRDVLAAERDSSRTSFFELEDKYKSLEDKYKALEGKYKALQDEHDELQSKYSRRESKIKNLENRIATSKGNPTATPAKSAITKPAITKTVISKPTSTLVAPATTTVPVETTTTPTPATTAAPATTSTAPTTTSIPTMPTITY